MSLRPLLAFLVALAVPIQAFAAPQTLSYAQLTEGSLLGPVQSTAQLQQEFAAHRALIAQATEELGLTHADFAAVRRAIDLGQARYVTLPRHLDGMSGQHNGKPFIDRDVIIPAGIHGWEVDLPKDAGMVRVFVPNACGNVSYVRTNKRYRVAAAHYAPVVAVPVSAAAASSVPPSDSAPAGAPMPEAIATAVPVAMVGPITPAAAAAPHLGWLGLLLVPIIVGLSGHGGASVSMPIAGRPPAPLPPGAPVPPGVPPPRPPAPTPVPIPIHTICPTAVIRVP